MAKFFLTGATGYIGGEVLHQLVEKFPQQNINVLVRDAVKAGKISSIYPDVNIVLGDLDNADVVSKEASKADVVLHLAATGHLKSVQTIHKALAEAQRQKPAYWIQVSGASALAAGEIADSNRVPGSESSAVFDDLDGVEEIRSIIRKHPFRAVDNYVLDVASNTPNVHTALVFPPIIYGLGHGPGNQRSVQVPGLSLVTLQRKRGLQLGKGLSRWGNVHVHDVSQLFVRLAEKAAEGNADDKLWNQQGLYLTGVGELSFGDISKQVAAAAAKQGLIPNDEVDELDGPAFDYLLSHGTVLFGTNARSKARRAKELLGWAPQQESLEAEIPRAVQSEAAQL